MKILVDMNLSSRWVEFFEAHGISAVRWSDLGAHDAPDEEIFAFAKANGWVIFSHDLDFSSLLARTSMRKPSLIQIRHSKPRPDEFGLSLVSILAENEEALNAGALLVVEPNRHRIRILPLFPDANS